MHYQMTLRMRIRTLMYVCSICSNNWRMADRRLKIERLLESKDRLMEHLDAKQEHSLDLTCIEDS